ncbi:hypothetical protein ABZP36_031849 [Zizania latifolia]
MAAAAAPTGCYKCGWPGHWSRDCPSDPAAASTDDPNPNPNRSASRFAPYTRPRFTKTAAAAEGEEGSGGQAQNNKKKRERAKRPKLTPDLLLSDDGLGFVLRYFPKAFKPRARPGHEFMSCCLVEDLGNLIKLYTDWHSHSIPYYSFDQFRCISELRERVARGGDPTLLHEPQVEEVRPEGEPDGATAEDPVSGTEAPLTENHGLDQVQEDIDPLVESNDVDPMQEDLLNDIYKKAADEPQIPAAGKRTEEAPQTIAPKEFNSHDDPPREAQKQPSKIQLTKEQRARMEANRLKALDRAAAAHARASQQT